MAKRFNAVIRRPNRRIRRNTGRKGLRNFLFSKLSAILLLLLVVATGSSYYFFASDKFLIKNIVIEGASPSIERDVRSYIAGFLESKMLFILKPDKVTLFPESKISRDLVSELPRIKEARVQIIHPDALKIEIIERTEHGIWCDYAVSVPLCYFYDSEGVIYQTAPNSVKGSLITPLRDKRGIDHGLGSEVVGQDIIDFTDKLAEALRFAYEKPFYISIEDNEEIRAGFSSGWEARFSMNNPVLESVENLILVIEEEIGINARELEYMDLRLGNKVFYKYKE
ncbi:MAG: hypothetical protein WD712_02485 [Candidatus Spechtbacterales bacterium]